LGLQGALEVEDGFGYELVADVGVEHDVVKEAGGPFDVEIFLDEVDAIAIDSVDEFSRSFFGFAATDEATDFVFPWSVEENAEGV